MPGPALERWHEIVRTRDTSGLRDLLAPDAVFESPIVHTPQRGRGLVLRYLESAVAVLGGPDFRYVGEWFGDDGVVLEFATRVDGLDVNGVDMIGFDPSRERITHFKVMIRPLKAINAVHQMMGAQLAAAQQAVRDDGQP